MPASGTSDINSMRNRLAAAQLQAGMDTSPIRSKWQGVARLADALMGGWGLRIGSRSSASDRDHLDARENGHFKKISSLNGDVSSGDNLGSLILINPMPAAS